MQLTANGIEKWTEKEKANGRDDHTYRSQDNVLFKLKTSSDKRQVNADCGNGHVVIFAVCLLAVFWLLLFIVVINIIR